MVLGLQSHILHFRLLNLYLTNITSPLPANILIETFEYYNSYYKHIIYPWSVQFKRNEPRTQHYQIRHIPHAHTSHFSQ
jgi:hypothetical protein